MTQLVVPGDEAQSRGSKRPEEIIRRSIEAQKFTKNFEHLVSVAGSTKHLKELVLQLGIRGQLCPDRGESADALVADLRQRRSKLAKEAGRVGDDLAPVPADQTPYSVPSGWRWIRIRDLGGFLGGGTPSKANAAFWTGPIPWVSPKDMKRPYIDDAEDHISKAAVVGSAVKLIPSPSLLYVVRGMILAHSFPVALTTRDVTINQDMKALVLAMPELAEFVLRSMQAARDRVLAMVERSSHGTCRLDSERVELLPVALPPLAEQKRIVAKVDQLMGLIDELDAKQTKKREVQTRFRTSALDALTKAEGTEELAEAWQRVAGNFGVLFERVESVHDLRQAVLWEATHGSLTDRDHAHDAHDLLQQIRITRRHRWEKARLAEMMAAGTTPGGDAWKAKYKQPVQPNQTARLVAGLPESWAIGSLDELAEVIDPNPSHRYPTYRNGVVPLLSTREFRGRDGWDATGKNVPLVPSHVHRDQDSRCRFAPRDIILARKGRLGLARHSPPLPAYVFSHTLFVIKVCEEMDPDFVLWFLRLDAVVTWLLREMNDNTGVPTLGKATTERLPLPVPPLEEQRRIVTKIEALMKLCDDLEAKLRAKEETAGKLVEAVLKELVAT